MSTETKRTGEEMIESAKRAELRQKINQKKELPHVIVFGASNSGKTSVTDYLENALDYKNLPPFGFFKRYLEHHYELPEFALDTLEGKQITPFGAKTNMDKWMVDFYHFIEEHDPYFTSRNLRKFLDTDWKMRFDMLCAGEPKFYFPIAFHGVRWNYELDVIFEKYHEYCQKVLCIVLSGRGESKSSDHLLKELVDRCIQEKDDNPKNFSVVNISNTGTKHDLYYKVLLAIHNY